jgi:hypothetical protein
MIRFIKRFFKRRYAKIQLSIRRTHVIKTYQEESGHEQKAKAIFRKLIKSETSKFTIAPLSEKRYIVNKKLGVFIILDDTKLEITNHVYHYELKLPYADALKLRKLFNDRLEKDTQEYESEIRANIQSSLNVLLDKIQNEIDNAG